MAVSPVLETARLRLEPFSERHLTMRYIGWLNDPEVVRYSEQRHRRHTLRSATAYLRSFEGTANLFWAILAKDAASHVGNITAYVDTANSVADIGILIGDKEIWGRGYGTEAWSAVCRFLLDDAGLRKVTGGTMSTNAGMLAIMRRSGMREDGVRRRQVVIDGNEVDLVHMALFASRRSHD